MTCPVCGSKTKVIDTCNTIDVIYRKRRCVSCGYTFNTEEVETDNPMPSRWSREYKENRQ